MRLEDNIDRRLRGGSRPGLTKFVAGNFGTSISDIVSINLSSATGSTEVLFVLVGSSIKTVTGGVVGVPTSYLGRDAGADVLVDSSGKNMLSSAASPPSSGFLVTGQQFVLAVNSSSITTLDAKTGKTDSVIPSAGTVPTGCTFGAVYRDRLILAGSDNTIYSSKMGDYSNWDYGRDVSDASRAIFWQLAFAGKVGPLPTAVIACRDVYLLMASAGSLWVLRGDPATGSLQRVSENIGIVSSKAWCKMDNTVFFLSKDGVYQVGTDGSNLSPLSQNGIPVELQNVNTATTTVLMGFERARNAIHVYLKTSGGNDTHWVYELSGKAWWPVRLQNNHSPLAVCQHQSELLLAGVDGYVRSVGGSDDDGTAIESHVLMGPMRLGTEDRSGIINMLRGVLASGSGTVTWRIVVGDHAEEASDNAKLAIEAFQSGGDYSGYVKFSDTWNAGRSLAQFPRTAGSWGCIWLQSTAKWGLEGANMQLKLSGRYR